MARKPQKGAEENKKPAPIISKLPIPISDSPLVIDLPDGQKLVVGRMIQGTVIEVATWRGTGRPDSRTSRLMLGMSIGDVNTPKEESAPSGTETGDASSSPSTPKRPQSSNKYIAMAQDLWIKIWGEPKPKKAKKGSKPAVSADGANAPVESMETIERINKTRFAGKPAISGKLPKFSAPKISAFSRGKKSSARSSKVASAEPRVSRREANGESDEIAAWLEEISEKARVKVEGKQAKESTAKLTPAATPKASAPTKAAPVKKAVKKSTIKPVKRK